MLFKAGTRSFFVVSKDVAKKKALSMANDHFKEKISELEVQSGKMLDEETVKIGCKGDVWVISRRGKA